MKWDVDLAERRRVELVAFMIIVMMTCAVIVFAVPLLLGQAWLRSRLELSAVLFAIAGGLFVLNRTRWRYAAAIALCVAPMTGNLIVAYQDPSDPIWYAFMPVLVILAAAVLTTRTAIILGIVSTLATAIVIAIRHASYGQRGAAVIAFVAMSQVLVLGLLRFRNRVERERLAEVERLARQLAATERLESIGRLAGGVAHDFNNLLTVILANVELARRGLAPQELLREIEDAATRATALTRQLLTFTRHRPGAPTTVVLDDTLAAMKPLLRRLVPEDIELELALGTRSAIDIDESQLQQVLLNLAANARDAMPDGGRLTFTTSTRTADGHDLVCLEVRDTGHGMDAATRDRALEPFFSTKPTGSGTGLGLATVHSIIQQAGGTIDLASTPAAGTTITIAFPRSTNRPAQTVVPGPAAGADLARGIALLVEDDPHVRSATERILRDLGLTVVVAASAAEVPRAVGDAPGPIELLVTDVVMPGRSGLELAAELRAAHPGLCIVLMSGYSEEDVVSAAERPNTRFVAKPFTTVALTTAVHELLGEPLGERASAAS